MDGRLLVGLLVTSLAVGGCNRSKSPPTAAAPPQKAAAKAEAKAEPSSEPSPAEEERAAAEHRRAMEQEAEFWRAKAREAEARQAMERENAQRAEGAYRQRTELTFPDTTVEGNLERPPADFSPQPLSASPPSTSPAEPPPTAATPHLQRAINPLRREAPPPSILPPAAAPPPLAAENPLRESASIPRMAASEPESTAAPPPILSVPAGGGSSGGGSGGAPLAALPPSAPSPPLSADYDLVEVFYGTDRLAAEPITSDWQRALWQFWPSAASFFLMLCLAFVATSRRSVPLALLAIGTFGVTLGLGYQDTAAALDIVRRAGHDGVRYTTERSSGGRVDRGLCTVTIPKKHVVGEVESPSLLRMEILEHASKHIVLHNAERIADARFYELLRQRVADSPRRELFVFVHGFNVSFDDAARRTAQIHHDLEFAGAPVFFSWPAHDKFIFTYPADETNVAWSVPHLKQFLLEIVKESQAQSINLIAHSMGNRALAAALREIELEMQGRSRLFNQVILAAPDIDADEFRMSIAPAMQRTAQRLTLYASARDDALLASQLVHHGPRAGDAGEGLVVVPGIDTIDVTAIDTSPWGHSYYGSSDPVLHDLRELFSRAIPPRDRTWLSPAERNGLTYWIFQPTRTAAADSGDSTR